ncbi:hypothetical protein [Cytobacillus purgationiresistens]|uniref:Alpha-amylase n=1 Tax=Cytobacillus purgationiresistens TaxID=863449 RepID=A0ABU0ANZ5_9BACI|nr:hypothetical protein [Cytobacillus purgationiresistens]MDQ0273009.1 hypothetical protein [Cytobacillus purgationiresistens]
MTKKNNHGSKNQNAPTANQTDIVSGDNSKGNKRNKDQKDKTEGQ